MSKYTPEQYAASAKKHGIPCGPYYCHRNEDSGMDDLNPGGFQITTSPDPTRAYFLLESIPREGDAPGNIKSLSEKVASLPDLLIALDEKDAEIAMLKEFGSQRIDQAERIGEMTREIERLRGALAAIRDWDTTPRTAGGCDYGKCAYIAIAALKGGAA